MSGTGLPEPASDEHEGPEPKATGAWAGYLIFALILLFLIVLGAQAAYEREWANVAGVTVFTVAFVAIPTGGVKWLRRSLNARKRRRA